MCYSDTLLDQGLYKAAIAPSRLHRRTINRWLAEGQLDRDVETGQVPRPVRQSRPTKLELYATVFDRVVGTSPIDASLISLTDQSVRMS